MMPSPLYCPKATINPTTGRKNMCGSERTVTDVADAGLCGDEDCYIKDLQARGWKCCDCKQKNDAGARHCKKNVIVSGRGSEAECQHYICRNCTYK